MITSFTLLQNSLDRYKRSKEKYSKWDASTVGISSGVSFGFLVIALLFFLMEIFVLFFAVNIAIECTKPGSERVIHVVMAIVFTLPYMLLNLFFGKCSNHMLGRTVLL